MVSDFVDEHNGFLMLTEDEYNLAKVTKPTLRRFAQEFLQINERREEYWTFK